MAAAALAATMLFAAGCADEETGAPVPEPQACGAGGTGETKSFLVSTLGFTRVDPMTGTAPGFDVDGVVSDGNDEGSCYKQDFVGPDGEEGVDNQIAVFVPELESILGDAVDGLVQGAINNGDLLIMLNAHGVDDLQNDDCVDLSVHTALGKPTLGTDGVIEAYQTFDRDPGSELSTATGARIEDGVLTAGPFPLAIPIAIFDVAFTIHIHDARLRVTVAAEDGELKKGVLGGGVVPDEVIDGVDDGAGVDQYTPFLSLVLHQSADLAPDAEGTCTRISGAFQISTVEAFVRPDE